MTQQEALDFIYNKQIPLSITLDNGDTYLLYFYITGCRLVYLGDVDIYQDMYVSEISFTSLFNSHKETDEETISDFLYWFETNKYRFKKITYYND